MYYSRMASVIDDICQFFRKTQAFVTSSLELCFFTHPYRTRRIAAKRRNLCATSTRAVATAASFTTWCTASWSRTARSARSSWSRRTGATPPAAGRPCSGPSARPAPTGQAPAPATGQVSLQHSHHASLLQNSSVVSFVLVKCDNHNCSCVRECLLHLTCPVYWRNIPW